MTTVLENQLLPCPFCGSENVGGVGRCIECDSCHATGPERKERWECVVAWNRRATKSEHAAQGGCVTDEVVRTARRAFNDYADKKPDWNLTKHYDEAMRAALEAVWPQPAAQGWMPDGVAMIATERRRQIEQEGWTLEHDDEHNEGELAKAAACYAIAAADGTLPHQGPPFDWPWDEIWWKPKDAIRDLVRAGALIAAEIGRLQRTSALPAPPQPQPEGEVE